MWGNGFGCVKENAFFGAANMVADFGPIHGHGYLRVHVGHDARANFWRRSFSKVTPGSGCFRSLSKLQESVEGSSVLVDYEAGCSSLACIVGEKSESLERSIRFIDVSHPPEMERTTQVLCEV